MVDLIIPEFIEATRKAECVDEVSALFGSTISKLGFNRWAYQIVNPPEEKHKKPVIISNYPESWVTHYVDQGYHLIDHVVTKGPQQVMPFTWSGLCKQYGMSPLQQTFFNEAADNGLPDGVGIPVHGANGSYAMISMSSQVGPQELERMLQSQHQPVHLISLVYNNVIRDLVQAERFGSVPPNLTPREKECLLWMSRGKTAWDIGHILTISEAAVKFHLANARTKLGVHSTKEALVIAIMHRLIQP